MPVLRTLSTSSVSLPFVTDSLYRAELDNCKAELEVLRSRDQRGDLAAHLAAAEKVREVEQLQDQLESHLAHSAQQDEVRAVR